MDDLAFTPRQAAFAEQGHPILPLHSITDAGECTCGSTACPSKGKHPFAEIAPNGAKNATADVVTVRGWFDENYWLSFGVVCDRLFVVDVDTKHGGLAAWRQLYSQPTRSCPHTWQVRTGSGGLHVYFKPVTDTNIRNGKLDSGITFVRVAPMSLGRAAGTRAVAFMYGITNARPARPR